MIDINNCNNIEASFKPLEGLGLSLKKNLLKKKVLKKLKKIKNKKINNKKKVLGSSNLATCSSYSITNYVKILAFHFFGKVKRRHLKMTNVN